MKTATPAPAVLLLALTLGVSATASAKLVVDEVVLHGAKKTTRGTIEARMGLKPGDRIDRAAMSAAQKRLMASRLFRSARVWLDLPDREAVEAMYLDPRERRVKLQVTVEEKLSWVVAPMASFGAGDYGGGVLYVDRNLLGRDLRVLAAGRHGQAESYGFAAFRDPLLGHLPLTYGVSGLFRREQIRFYEDHRRVFQVPTTLAGGDGALGWVLTPNLSLSLAVAYRRQWLSAGEALVDGVEDPPVNPRQGNQLVFRLEIAYDDTTAPQGLQRGVKLCLKPEISDAVWMSDYDYVRFEFLLELYGYLFKTYPSATLHTVLLNPTSPRGAPVTELLRLGGTNLRGFQKDEFLGDRMVALQLEEQVLLWHGIRLPWVGTELNLAAAAFADVGTMFARHPGGLLNLSTVRPKITLSQWHLGLGAGLRVILPGVAIPAVKIDFGYGVDVNDYAITISIAGGGERL